MQRAPGCTKVTKCHLPKATRCAPLQASSSRRPVRNYMFLLPFLYFRPSFFLLLHYPATTTNDSVRSRATRERAYARDRLSGVSGSLESTHLLAIFRTRASFGAMDIIDIPPPINLSLALFRLALLCRENSDKRKVKSIPWNKSRNVVYEHSRAC